MRLHLLSDIHLDKNQEQTTEQLIEIFLDYCKELHSDLLVINGDLSRNLKLNEEIQNILENQYRIHTVLIPGNHELDHIEANRENGYVGLFTAYKNEVLYNRNKIDKALKLTDKWMLLPALGLPDGSFETQNSYSYIQENLEEKPIPFDMEEARNLLLQQMEIWENELRKYPNQSFVFAQHYVPLSIFSSYDNNDLLFQFRTRTLGSNLIGDFIRRNEQIRTIHFGHTHMVREHRMIWGKDFYCYPAGLLKESKDKSFFDLLQENTVELNL